MAGRVFTDDDFLPDEPAPKARRVFTDDDFAPDDTLPGPAAEVKPPQAPAAEPKAGKFGGLSGGVETAVLHGAHGAVGRVPDAIAAAISATAGPYPEGESWGDRYDAAMQNAARVREQSADERPVVAGASDFAGSVLPYVALPASAAARGLPAAAGLGGLIGGAQSLAKGGDAGDVAIGTVMGAAAPLVEPVAAAVAPISRIASGAIRTAPVAAAVGPAAGVLADPNATAAQKVSAGLGAATGVLTGANTLKREVLQSRLAGPASRAAADLDAEALKVATKAARERAAAERAAVSDEATVRKAKDAIADLPSKIDHQRSQALGEQYTRTANWKPVMEAAGRSAEFPEQFKPALVEAADAMAANDARKFTPVSERFGPEYEAAQRGKLEGELALAMADQERIQRAGRVGDADVAAVRDRMLADATKTNDRKLKWLSNPRSGVVGDVLSLANPASDRTALRAWLGGAKTAPERGSGAIASIVPRTRRLMEDVIGIGTNSVPELLGTNIPKGAGGNEVFVRPANAAALYRAIQESLAKRVKTGTNAAAAGAAGSVVSSLTDDDRERLRQWIESRK